jgi:hypothetical protein
MPASAAGSTLAENVALDFGAVPLSRIPCAPPVPPSPRSRLASWLCPYSHSMVAGGFDETS